MILFIMILNKFKIFKELNLKFNKKGLTLYLSSKEKMIKIQMNGLHILKVILTQVKANIIIILQLIWMMHGNLIVLLKINLLLRLIRVIFYYLKEIKPLQLWLVLLHGVILIMLPLLWNLHLIQMMSIFLKL